MRQRLMQQAGDGDGSGGATPVTLPPLPDAVSAAMDTIFQACENAEMTGGLPGGDPRIAMIDAIAQAATAVKAFGQPQS